MKDTEKIRAQMHEILDIVLDGNGFEERTRESTGTLPTLFMDFSGHVDNQSVHVRLFEDGWCLKGHNKSFYFSAFHENSEQRIEALRSAVRQALSDKKAESEILARAIEAKQSLIANEKERLKELRKSLRKAEKKEKAAVDAAT